MFLILTGMEETLRLHLFELADAFEASTGQKRPAVGRAALNDNKFFARLEAGDGFTVRTFDRLRDWFADNWPAETAWPDGIDRPVTPEPEPIP